MFRNALSTPSPHESRPRPPSGNERDFATALNFDVLDDDADYQIHLEHDHFMGSDGEEEEGGDEVGAVRHQGSIAEPVVRDFPSTATPLPLPIIDEGPIIEHIGEHTRAITSTLWQDMMPLLCTVMECSLAEVALRSTVSSSAFSAANNGGSTASSPPSMSSPPPAAIGGANNGSTTVELINAIRAANSYASAGKEWCAQRDELVAASVHDTSNNDNNANNNDEGQPMGEEQGCATARSTHGRDASSDAADVPWLRAHRQRLVDAHPLGKYWTLDGSDELGGPLSAAGMVGRPHRRYATNGSERDSVSSANSSSVHLRSSVTAASTLLPISTSAVGSVSMGNAAMRRISSKGGLSASSTANASTAYAHGSPMQRPQQSPPAVPNNGSFMSSYAIAANGPQPQQQLHSTNSGGGGFQEEPPSIAPQTADSLSAVYCETVYHSLSGLHAVVDEVLSAANAVDVRSFLLPSPSSLRGQGQGHPKPLSAEAAATGQLARFYSYTTTVDAVVAMLLQLEHGVLELLGSSMGLLPILTNATGQNAAKAVPAEQSVPNVNALPSAYNGYAVAGQEQRGSEHTAKANAAMVRLLQHLHAVIGDERHEQQQQQSSSSPSSSPPMIPIGARASLGGSGQYAPLPPPSLHRPHHGRDTMDFVSSSSHFEEGGASPHCDTPPVAQHHQRSAGESLGDLCAAGEGGIPLRGLSDDGVSGRRRLLWLRSLLRIEGDDAATGGHQPNTTNNLLGRGLGAHGGGRAASPIPDAPVHGASNSNSRPPSRVGSTIGGTGAAAATPVNGRQHQQRHSSILEEARHSTVAARCQFVIDDYESTVVAPFSGNLLQHHQPIIPGAMGGSRSAAAVIVPPPAPSRSPLQRALWQALEAIVSSCFTGLIEGILSRQCWSDGDDSHDDAFMAEITCANGGGNGATSSSFFLERYRRWSVIASVDIMYDQQTSLGNADVVRAMAGIGRYQPSSRPTDSAARVDAACLISRLLPATQTTRCVTVLLGLAPPTLRRLSRRAVRIAARLEIPIFPSASGLEGTVVMKSKHSHPSGGSSTSSPTSAPSVVAAEARLRSTLWPAIHSEAAAYALGHASHIAGVDAAVLKQSFIMSIIKDFSGAVRSNQNDETHNAAPPPPTPAVLFRDALPSLKEVGGTSVIMSLLQVLKEAIEGVARANAPVRSSILSPSSAVIAAQKRAHVRLYAAIETIADASRFPVLALSEEAAFEAASLAKQLAEGGKGCKVTKGMACKLLSKLFGPVSSAFGFAALSDRTRAVIEGLFQNKIADWMTRPKYALCALPCAVVLLCVGGRALFVRDAPKVFTSLLRAAADLQSFPRRHTRASFLTCCGALLTFFLTYVLHPVTGAHHHGVSADRRQLENTFRTMMGQLRDFSQNVLRKGPSLFGTSAVAGGNGAAMGSGNQLVSLNTSPGASPSPAEGPATPSTTPPADVGLIVAYADIVLSLCAVRPISVGFPLLLECFPSDKEIESSLSMHAQSQQQLADAVQSDLTAAGALALKVVTEMARDEFREGVSLEACLGMRRRGWRGEHQSPRAPALIELPLQDTRLLLDGYFNGNPYELPPVAGSLPEDWGFIPSTRFSFLRLGEGRRCSSSSSSVVPTAGRRASLLHNGVSQFHNLFDAAALLAGASAVDLSSLRGYTEGLVGQLVAKQRAVIRIDTQSSLRDVLIHAAQWSALELGGRCKSACSPDGQATDEAMSVSSSSSMSGGTSAVSSSLFDRPMPFVEIIASVLCGVGMHSAYNINFSDGPNASIHIDPCAGDGLSGGRFASVRLCHGRVVRCISAVLGCLESDVLPESSDGVALRKLTDADSPLFDANPTLRVGRSEPTDAMNGLPLQLMVVTMASATFWEPSLLLQTFIKSVAMSRSACDEQSSTSSSLSTDDAVLVATEPSSIILVKSLLHSTRMVRSFASDKLLPLLLFYSDAPHVNAMNHSFDDVCMMVREQSLLLGTSSSRVVTSGSTKRSAAGRSAVTAAGGAFDASPPYSLPSDSLQCCRRMAEVRHKPAIHSLRLAAIGMGPRNGGAAERERPFIWSHYASSMAHATLIKLSDVCVQLYTQIAGPLAEGRTSNEQLHARWLQASVKVLGYAVSQLCADGTAEEILSTCIPPAASLAMAQKFPSVQPLLLEALSSAAAPLPSIRLRFPGLASLPLLDGLNALTTMLLNHGDAKVRACALASLAMPLHVLTGRLAYSAESQDAAVEQLIIEQQVVSQLEEQCLQAMRRRSSVFIGGASNDGRRSSASDVLLSTQTYYQDPLQQSLSNSNSPTRVVPKLTFAAGIKKGYMRRVADDEAGAAMAAMLLAREVLLQIVAVPRLSHHSTGGGGTIGSSPDPPAPLSLFSIMQTVGVHVLEDYDASLIRTSAYGCHWGVALSERNSSSSGRKGSTVAGSAPADAVTSNSFGALAAVAKVRRVGSDTPYGPAEYCPLTPSSSNDGGQLDAAVSLAEAYRHPSVKPIVLTATVLAHTLPLASPFFASAVSILCSSPASAIGTAPSASAGHKHSRSTAAMSASVTAAAAMATATAGGGGSAHLGGGNDGGAAYCSAFPTQSQLEGGGGGGRWAMDVWRAQFIIGSMVCTANHAHPEELMRRVQSIESDASFSDGLLQLIADGASAPLASTFRPQALVACDDGAGQRFSDLITSMGPLLYKHYALQDVYDTLWFVVDEVVSLSIHRSNSTTRSTSADSRPQPACFVSSVHSQPLLELAHRMATVMIPTVARKEPMRAMLLASIGVPLLKCALTLTNRGPSDGVALHNTFPNILAYQQACSKARVARRSQQCPMGSARFANRRIGVFSTADNEPIDASRARLPTARSHGRSESGGVFPDTGLYPPTSSLGGSGPININVSLVKFIDAFDVFFMLLTGNGQQMASSSEGSKKGSSRAGSMSAAPTLTGSDATSSGDDSLLFGKRSCGLYQGALLPSLPPWAMEYALHPAASGVVIEYEDFARYSAASGAAAGASSPAADRAPMLQWEHSIGLRAREALFAVLCQFATDGASPASPNHPIALPAFPRDRGELLLLCEREEWAGAYLSSRLSTLLPNGGSSSTATLNPRAVVVCAEMLGPRQGMFLDFVSNHLLYLGKPMSRLIAVMSTSMPANDLASSESMPGLRPPSSALPLYSVACTTLAALATFHMAGVVTQEGGRLAPSLHTYYNALGVFERSLPPNASTSHPHFGPDPSPYSPFNPPALPSNAIASLIADPIRSNMGATALFMLLVDRFILQAADSLSAAVTVASRIMAGSIMPLPIGGGDVPSTSARLKEHFAVAQSLIPTMAMLSDSPMFASVMKTTPQSNLGEIALCGIRTFWTNLIVTCPSFAEQCFAKYTAGIGPFAASTVCSPVKLVQYTIAAEAVIIYPLLMMDRPPSTQVLPTAAMGIPHWPSEEPFRVIEQRRIAKQLLLQSLLVVGTGGLMVSRPSADCPMASQGSARMPSLVPTARQVLAMCCTLRVGGTHMTASDFIDAAVRITAHVEEEQEEGVHRQQQRRGEMAYWMAQLFSVASKDVGLRLYRPDRSFFAYCWSTIAGLVTSAEGAQLGPALKDACHGLLQECALYHPGIAEPSFIRSLQQVVMSLPSPTCPIAVAIWQNLEANRCPAELHTLTVMPWSAASSAGSSSNGGGSSGAHHSLNPSAGHKIKTVATPLQRLAHSLLVGVNEMTISDSATDSDRSLANEHQQQQSLSWGECVFAINGFLGNWTRKVAAWRAKQQQRGGASGKGGGDGSGCDDDGRMGKVSAYYERKRDGGGGGGLSPSSPQGSMSLQDVSPSSDLASASNFDSREYPPPEDEGEGEGVDRPTYCPSSCTDDGLAQLQVNLLQLAAPSLIPPLPCVPEGHQSVMREALRIARVGGGGITQQDISSSFVFALFSQCYKVLRTAKSLHVTGSSAASSKPSPRVAPRPFVDVLLDVLRAQQEAGRQRQHGASSAPQRAASGPRHGVVDATHFNDMPSLLVPLVALHERFPGNSSRTLQLRRVGLSSPTFAARMAKIFALLAPDLLEQHVVLKSLVATEVSGEWMSAATPIYYYASGTSSSSDGKRTPSPPAARAKHVVPRYSAIARRQYLTAVQRRTNKQTLASNEALMDAKCSVDHSRFMECPLLKAARDRARRAEEEGEEEERRVGAKKDGMMVSLSSPNLITVTSPLDVERTFVTNESGTVKIYSSNNNNGKRSAPTAAAGVTVAQPSPTSNKATTGAATVSNPLTLTPTTSAIVPPPSSSPLRQRQRHHDLGGTASSFGRQEMSIVTIGDSEVDDGTDGAAMRSLLASRSAHHHQLLHTHNGRPRRGSAEGEAEDNGPSPISAKAIDAMLTPNDWMVVTMDTLSELSDTVSGIFLGAAVDESFLAAPSPTAKGPKGDSGSGLSALLRCQHLPQRIALDFLICSVGADDDEPPMRTAARHHHHHPALSYQQGLSESSGGGGASSSHIAYAHGGGYYGHHEGGRGSHSATPASAKVSAKSTPASREHRSSHNALLRVDAIGIGSPLSHGPANSAQRAASNLSSSRFALPSRAPSQSSIVMHSGSTPTHQHLSPEAILATSTSQPFHLNEAIGSSSPLLGGCVLPRTLSSATMVVNEAAGPVIDPTAAARGHRGFHFGGASEASLAPAGEEDDSAARRAGAAADAKARAVYTVILTKMVKVLSHHEAARAHTEKVARSYALLYSSSRAPAAAATVTAKKPQVPVGVKEPNAAANALLLRYVLQSVLSPAVKQRLLKALLRSSVAAANALMEACTSTAHKAMSIVNHRHQRISATAAASRGGGAPLSRGGNGAPLSQQQQAVATSQIGRCADEVRDQLLEASLRPLLRRIEFILGSDGLAMMGSSSALPTGDGGGNLPAVVPLVGVGVASAAGLGKALRAWPNRCLVTYCHLLKCGRLVDAVVAGACGNNGNGAASSTISRRGSAHQLAAARFQPWEVLVSTCADLLSATSRLRGMHADLVGGGDSDAGGARRCLLTVVHQWSQWGASLLGVASGVAVTAFSSAATLVAHNNTVTDPLDWASFIPKAMVCPLPDALAAHVYGSGDLHLLLGDVSCDGRTWASVRRTFSILSGNKDSVPNSCDCLLTDLLLPMQRLGPALSGPMGLGHNATDDGPSHHSAKAIVASLLARHLSVAHGSVLVPTSDADMGPLKAYLRSALILPLLFVGSRAWSAHDDGPAWLRCASLKAQLVLLALLSLRCDVIVNGGRQSSPILTVVARAVTDYLLPIQFVAMASDDDDAPPCPLRWKGKVDHNRSTNSNSHQRSSTSSQYLRRLLLELRSHQLAEFSRQSVALMAEEEEEEDGGIATRGGLGDEELLLVPSAAHEALFAGDDGALELSIQQLVNAWTPLFAPVMMMASDGNNNMMSSPRASEMVISVPVPAADGDASLTVASARRQVVMTYSCALLDPLTTLTNMFTHIGTVLSSTDASGEHEASDALFRCGTESALPAPAAQSGTVRDLAKEAFVSVVDLFGMAKGEGDADADEARTLLPKAIATAPLADYHMDDDPLEALAAEVGRIEMEASPFAHQWGRCPPYLSNYIVGGEDEGAVGGDCYTSQGLTSAMGSQSAAVLLNGSAAQPPSTGAPKKKTRQLLAWVIDDECVDV